MKITHIVYSGLGGAFSVIDSFINLKMEEVTAMRASPQPLEFDLYYSC